VNRHTRFYGKWLAGREIRAILPGQSGSQFVGRARLENMLGSAPFFVGQVLKLDEEIVALPDIF